MIVKKENLNGVTIEAEDDLDRIFLGFIGGIVSPKCIEIKSCPGKYMDVTFRLEFKSGRGTYNPKTGKVEK